LADVLHAAADDATRAGVVSEVRAGFGFLGAIELVPELLAGDPGLVAKLGLAVRSRGVMVRPLGSAIAVSPPLICTREHVDLIGDAISGALAEIAGSVAIPAPRMAP
jgi:putrescine aminotransferase